MKKNLHILIFTLLLSCGYTYMFSQQITVDNTVDLQPLIENNLVDGCVNISNIESSVNGIPHGLPSYGYFQRASSNFPFESGIILTTGNAVSAGNGLITSELSEGSTIWGTDPDLEVALGTTNTLNATSIEFDIVSISSQFQFNYLFASEDYDGQNPCNISDGFVFLIKETGSTDAYQNIALVPGTSIPVNTSNVHPNLGGNCIAQNEQYFDGYNTGDTNYIGRTTVLTATTTITPNVSYHIKLIIADQTDGTFDSAVFIEGDSFKILNLGEDIETCASSALLDADIQNPLATYEWFLNGSTTPISGETNPTLSAIQSGTYTVEVTVPLNGNSCTETDEIVVTLNTEETIPPITDYELCDNIGGNGTGIIFDLSTKDVELDSNINTVFSNYTFGYYLSDNDARNNNNEITTPITNTFNPQPIYVRVEDLDTNCFGYTSFNLVANQIPNINTPTPLEVCDNDDSPDGFTVIYLTEKDDEITGSDPNLNVTYHYNSTDANTGDNPIPAAYININTPTDLVYVRVFNLQTGCFTTTTLDVNITTSPIINRDTQYLDACDLDLDGSDNFNLQDAINDILDGLPSSGVSITFHENYDDADTGDNAIADETNYQYSNPITEPGYATIYVRVEDNTTGCASIVPLEIHTNLLLTGTDTSQYAICDTNDDKNDTLKFDLNTIQSYILRDLILDNFLDPISISFFETPEQRDSNANPIPKNILYEATSPKVLYIRLENTVTGCFQLEDINLLVNPVLLFTPLSPVSYCDTDDDGIVSIDLHSLDNEITNGNPDFEVTYFVSTTDAENNENQLPPFFPNTKPIEDLVARITNIDTGCHTENPFQIKILVAPAANQPAPIIICDNDQDGFSIINLEDKISEVVPNTTDLNIAFFTTFNDADAGSNPIPQNELSSYNANTQTIYIRVESSLSNSNGCYNIVELEIIVNTLPIIPTISNFQICQSGGSSTADFLLANKDAEILNGQTGKEVYYFEDAAFSIPIDKNTSYQNTSSPQTIYVRVENITDTSCFNTSSFIIQVTPDPIYTKPEPFVICDDISNDEIEVFDLNEKTTEINQGANETLNVTYYKTRTEAENNIGALPTNYTNDENPQTLFIRIESADSFCFVIEQLELIIVPAPNITEVTTPITSCDIDYDGSTTFNLEDADFQILDRIQTNLIINYFENYSDINQEDALDNTNEIPNPQNFISDSKTVYIKVTNTLSECFSIIPLELVVNLPPETNNLETISICDNDTDTYDLSEVDAMIVDDSSLVNISYHNTPNDAENNLLPIGNMFNYTTSSHTIFARVSDINTGCPIVTPFDLQINPNPTAIAPPITATEKCDDDYDDLLAFNLTQSSELSNAIRGGLNASTYSVSYYDDIDKAENKDEDTLNNGHLSEDGDVIFARLENTSTGCYSTTQFTVTILPLPIINLEDVEIICLDDLPRIINADTGNPEDTYYWFNATTNRTETTPEITLNISDANDTWSLTITRPSTGCNETKSFQVMQSVQATIDFTTTVDFSDPNSITVGVNTGSIGNYVYILDDGEPQNSNFFNNVSIGPHVVTVRDLNGCEDVSQDVVVIDVPKFVTPNGDGYFDTWHITGVNQLTGTVIFIYNRHGKLLKTLPHTSTGWDGTYNGENMPSDDYWYVGDIFYKGTEFQMKGHFALKR
ncbi:choice-of-anchor L domain-containing protein [Thalassobellus citreus]|uniref:choice-of-anchor L domain-containing protein n=1 Tax=Thalassobellus citreus TaxID=3367752 RepID=UPI003791FE6E